MTITPQSLSYDVYPPAYSPVTASDEITIGSPTFLHFYNGSAVNDNIVFYFSGSSTAATVVAGDELFLGPFTETGTLTVTHTHTTGVVMAALTPATPLTPLDTPFMVDTSITGLFYNVELMNTFDISMNSKMVDVTPAFQDEIWSTTEVSDGGLSLLPYTYVSVTSSDEITIGTTTFIHFYNGSASNDAIAYYSATATLPAGEELFLGPFDIDTYGTTITITHTHITDVVMAVITSEPAITSVYSPKQYTWSQQRPTLNSMTFSGSGFFDYYNDITGQKLVMDNAINGAALAGRAYLTSFSGGAASYITTDLLVTDFTIRTNPHGMVEFSFSADTTGVPSFTT